MYEFHGSHRSVHLAYSALHEHQASSAISACGEGEASVRLHLPVFEQGCQLLMLLLHGVDNAYGHSFLFPVEFAPAKVGNRIISVPRILPKSCHHPVRPPSDAVFRAPETPFLPLGTCCRMLPCGLQTVAHGQ